MSAFDNFKRLNVNEQKGFISRVKAGMVDTPPQFSAMVALYESHNYDRAQLPGGVTLLEQSEYEARVRAGKSHAPLKGPYHRDPVPSSNKFKPSVPWHGGDAA